jgi:hypothetical protein
MRYLIHDRSIEGILHVEALDYVGLPGLLQMIDETKKVSQQSWTKLILIDLSQAQYEMPFMDQYRVGEAVAKRQVPGVRIAVILKPQYITRFSENVACNRGAGMRVFADRQQALDWLRNPA